MFLMALGLALLSQWACMYNGLTNKLDCDREASHNLNRLLDKPGPECLRSLIENIFLEIAPV